MASQAHSKKLELVYSIATETPDNLTGDPGRLRQILVNLVGNSIKFTTNGEVVLKVCPEREGDNYVELHFTVTDSGIGIPKDKFGTDF